jgi:hypothetical protein
VNVVAPVPVMSAIVPDTCELQASAIAAGSSHKSQRGRKERIAPVV